MKKEIEEKIKKRRKKKTKERLVSPISQQNGLILFLAFLSSSNGTRFLFLVRLDSSFSTTKVLPLTQFRPKRILPS